jgi:hypothetical protein
MHCRGGGQVERQRIVRAGRDRHVQALGGRPRLAAAEPEVDVRDDGVPTGVIVERSKCQSSSSTPGLGRRATTQPLTRFSTGAGLP